MEAGICMTTVKRAVLSGVICWLGLVSACARGLQSSPMPDQQLADLAENLARDRDALEADNARLRERLAKAMGDLYSSSSPGRREALLLAFVKDPLADIRLVAIEITARRLAADEKVSPGLALQIHGALGDSDPRVRRAAALLAASLAERRTLELLLARLDMEKVREVRQGLLTAVGRLKDTRALPAVLKGIADSDGHVAAAAAGALAAIASKQPLPADLRLEVVKTLIERYRRNATSENGAALREALLTAMGAVRDRAVTGVLLEALKDSAATVRLAAVNGLAQFGDPSLTASLAALTADSDRGVRQAAITALGVLGGEKYLGRILDRTRPAVEDDGAVRTRAWEVAMAVLSGGEADVLWSVSESLARREDCPEQRIKIAQMLVDRLTADKDARLPSAQRRLAGALLKGARPAEAAAQLSKAFAALKKVDSAEAAPCWLEWVEALLAAGDATVIKVISDEKEKEEGSSAFMEACGRLETRLGQLVSAGRYDQAAEIALGAVETLGPRLDKRQKARISQLLNDARAKQAAADRQRVARLVLQLAASDAAAARTASAALKGMGNRAVAPLVEELKLTVAAAGQGPNPPAETAILEILAQIAPRLSPYDPKAPTADRLKRIEVWRKALSSPEPGK